MRRRATLPLVLLLAAAADGASSLTPDFSGDVRPILSGASDFGFNGVRDRVYLHNLNATILHRLGLDHPRLTHRFQGRDFRLTDVHGRVVEEIPA